VAQPSEKSIAVLPFADMSADPGGDWFGDGIAEEIINALTQLPGLKVAARTSAFSFKGKNEDLRTVGERLGVTNVLEGSVRRAGSRVRITAQLIEVASGYHLWSERFDRELTDIFAIQDDIATGIAAKLKVTLGAEEDFLEQARRAWDEPLRRLDEFLRQEQLVKPRTDNVEAYERYLQGRAVIRHRGGELATAVAAFEQAVALDPHFASAHAELAQALALQAFWGGVPVDEVRERALVAAARAMAAAPLLPEANTATALTAILLRYDRASAAAAWQRAIELDPSNPDTRILRAMFDLTYVRGDFERALAALAAAIERDPESAYAYTSQAVVLTYARRFEEAVTSAARAVELDPNSLYAEWSLFQALGFSGRADEVLARGRTVLGRFGRHPWLLLGISIAGAAAGRPALADAVYAELTGRAGIEPVQPIVIAGVALNAGRRDEALGLLERAAIAREPLLTAFVLHWPGLAALRGSPRYARLMATMGWDRDPG
jgi:serine/threonine-protein kinase